MTLENESTPVQPAKPARRRVTRTTAAPKIEPVQFLKAEPAQEVAPKTTVGHAEVVSGVQKPETPAAPRRSRRVVSSGKAATTSVAVSGTATQIAQQATEANERAQQETVVAKESSTPASTAEPKKRSTNQKAAGNKKASGTKKAGASAAKSTKNADNSELSAEAQPQLDVFGELEGAAKKPAKRGGKKRAEKPAEEATNASTQATQQPELVQEEPAREGGAEPRTANRTRNRRRATTAREAPSVQTEDSAATEVEETAEKVETPKQTAGKSSNTRTRSRRSNVFSDAQSGTPEEKAPAETAAPSRPRLATTALLFQAPDLSTVPARSAGAQIAEPEVEEVEETSAELDAEVVEETQEAAVRTNKRDRNRNRNRSRSATATDGEAGVAPKSEAAPDAEEPVEVDTEDESDSDNDSDSPRRRRRRGGRGRRNRNSSENSDSSSEDEQDETSEQETTDEDSDSDSYSDNDEYSSSRRRRRRRRTRGNSDDSDSRTRTASDEVTALKGSTRLEAKRQRRREGRDAGRRRTIITEAEFLARRESVERSMVVRERNGRTQIAVLEDGVLVEHYVSQQSQASMAGNVYLGRVQNVLPSMEAAFVDIGKGRNAVLYAGEVNWDIHGVDGQPRRIEDALKSGDSVLVQVTKDPIGHKGARLTSQVTLAGRYLVFVPGGGMTGISRKLPDTERNRLKRILREVVPEGAGVIVRTAAEGASEEELTADIERLRTQWEAIEKKSKTANAPALLQGEPDLAIRVVRDIFNDDFTSLKVQGDGAWNEISEYVKELAPDLADRVSRWTSEKDIFSQARIDEQLTKGMDRKVWLPSGGSLVIDRTEAMTVIDVNTGKFTGAGGTLEETVTRNNLEAAEEIVRQLRLRDIGGIIVIDFIDMVLESNRDLVLRRLVECLGRDRTKHQVAEVTSLGLVQMTRKRVGQGLVEAFSTTCDHCNGRGFVVHEEPNEKQGQHAHNNSPVVSGGEQPESKRSRRKRSAAAKVATEQAASTEAVSKLDGDKEARDAVKAKLATIAAAAAHAHSPEDGSEAEGFEAADTAESVEVQGSASEATIEAVEPAAAAQDSDADAVASDADAVASDVDAVASEEDAVAVDDAPADGAYAEIAQSEVAQTEAIEETAPVVEPTTSESDVVTATEVSEANEKADESTVSEASVSSQADAAPEAPEAPEAPAAPAAPEASATVPVLDVLAEFGFKDSGKN